MNNFKKYLAIVESKKVAINELTLPGDLGSRITANRPYKDKLIDIIELRLDNPWTKQQIGELFNKLSPKKIQKIEEKYKGLITDVKNIIIKDKRLIENHYDGSCRDFLNNLNISKK
jgi:hypothetical protein